MKRFCGSSFTSRTLWAIQVLTMIKNNRSQQVRKGVLISILIFIWLAALVFYWSVDPRFVTRHFLASIFLSYLLLWSLVFLLSNQSKTEVAQRFLLASVSVYSSFTKFDADAQPLKWVINDLPKRLKAIVREELPDGEFLDLTPAL